LNTTLMLYSVREISRAVAPWPPLARRTNSTHQTQCTDVASGFPEV
jgi:hypothetical protein